MNPCHCIRLYVKFVFFLAWSNWGGWGTCSEVCGSLVNTTRSRTCVDFVFGDDLADNSRCPGDSMEEKSCNLAPCIGKPFMCHFLQNKTFRLPILDLLAMHPWGPWSRAPCLAATCGLNLNETRTRGCYDSDTDIDLTNNHSRY